MMKKSTKIICLLVVLMFVLVIIPNVTGKPAEFKGNKNCGIKRHTDIIKDSDGTLHMVWQQPVDGQYEVFYCAKPKGKGNSKEMGIGTNRNPTTQLSDTSTDSVWPKITIDSSSDIIYVIWTEHFLSDGDDAAYHDDSPAPSILYSAFKQNDDDDEETPYWTKPINIADGSKDVKSFAVEESEFQINIKEPEEYSLRGVMDTDRDKIKDSDEVLGTKGYITDWSKSDTDNDGLKDYIELEWGLNPLLDDSTTQWSKLFFEAVLMTSDTDSDNLIYAEEVAWDFPVTMGVVNILHGGYVTYQILPRDDHEAYLKLGLQLRRTGLLVIPPAVNAYFKIDVTVTSGDLEEYEVAYSDHHMEWERFFVEVGPFDLEMDEITDIEVEVDLIPPFDDMFYQRDVFNDSSYQNYVKSLEIWSVLVRAPAPDYGQFYYKEGRDYMHDESDLAGDLIQNFDTRADQRRPDVFLEVDWLTGHEMPPEFWSELVNIYSDAGIILHYRIDERNLPLASPVSHDDDGDDAEILIKVDELQDFFHRHRNEDLDRYIYILIGHYIRKTNGQFLYGTAKSADTADNITYSGIGIADQELVDTVTGWSDLMERRLKVIAHEIGHALCCAHEKDDGFGGIYDARVDGDDGVDDMNDYNLMRQNHVTDGIADELLRGEGNDNRDLGAIEDIGRPRFSIESIEQMDLTNKLSADTGRNYELLGNYV
jgi:hypothetical protein